MISLGNAFVALRTLIALFAVSFCNTEPRMRFALNHLASDVQRFRHQVDQLARVVRGAHDLDREIFQGRFDRSAAGERALL